MGKKSRPVVTIGDSDLIDNGGRYKLVGKTALKVSGDDTSQVMGGKPFVVYPVSSSQIESGEFNLSGGNPVEVAQVSGRGRESSKYAIPVHDPLGTWPSSAPATVTYAETLRDTYGFSEIWSLVDMATKPTIPAFINSARDGTLDDFATQWVLQSAAGPVTGTLAPDLLGGGSHAAIYTANGVDGLADIFDGTAGTMLAWFKVEAATWTDGNLRFLMRISKADLTNLIQINKVGIPSNTMRIRYRAGGTFSSIDATVSSTDWTMATITWDAGADEVKAYINDSQVGTTLNGLGTWVGPIANDFTGIGSAGISVGSPWDGLIAYCAVKFGAASTPEEVSAIYATASTAVG